MISKARKKIVGIVCGGRSGEHEVSLRSSFYVYHNLDKRKYRVVLLAIGKNGHWYFGRKFQDLINTRGKLWKLKRNLEEIVLVKSQKQVKVFSLQRKKNIITIDVFFPLIHGTYGEDGCLQGFLELLDIPYVGADVLGSAIGMDKEVTKRLLREAKISVTEFVVLRKKEQVNEQERKISQAIKEFNFPLFVKPVHLGSSVGVSKVFKRQEINKAIQEAFKYDHEIMIEKFVPGREIECSILDNSYPKASLPGEIKTRTFYSYRAKYLDDQEAKLLAPAPLSKGIIKKIQKLSIKVFQILKLHGMARVDMFLKPDNSIIINEVNTIPGFTQISMYPKLWQISGISYARLLDRLIALGIQSYKEKQKLKRSYF